MKFSTFLVALLLPATAFAGCIDFPRDLKQGMSGNDVYALQKILNNDSLTAIASSGVGSPGLEQDYFSAKVSTALKSFQKLYATELIPEGASSSPSGIATLATRTKLSRLSCEIDVARPIAPTTTPTQLGSGLCGKIPLAPAPRPKVRLDNPIVYQVRRGDVFALYGANFTDNNTVDIGNKSICFAGGSDNGHRIDITIPLDAGLGIQFVRVTNKYGQSNLIKILVLEASPHSAWSGGCVNLSRSLSLGSKGADVRTLQRFLNSDTRTQVAADGLESYSKETELFSERTKSGVMSFQKLYAADVLRPVNQISPTGVVGQLAAKKIRELTNCPNLDTPPIVTKRVPTLVSIQPKSGSEGDDIVLRGTNFTGENTVLFGGAIFGPYGSTDGKSIIVRLTSLIPTGKMPVMVRTVNGKSKSVDFTMLTTAATTTPPGGNASLAPHINSFIPARGKPGVTIRILGSGFTSESNSITDSASGLSKTGIASKNPGTEMALTIPTITKPGVLNLRVENANGKSNTRAFIVEAEHVTLPPVIDKINPAAAKQGTTVIIEGRYFEDPSSVIVDGIPFADYHVSGITRIALTIPLTMAVGDHEVVIKNPVATSNKATLTVIDKNADVPVIESIDPATGKSGDTVLIKGRNLAGVDLVYFGTTLASSAFGAGAGTEVSLFIRNMDPGNYKVHIQNKGGVSNEVPFSVYKDEKPHISSLVPVEVYPGSAVNIFGKNLTGGWVVVGGKTLSAVDNGAQGTSITTTIPSDMGAGTFMLHVSTEKGDSNELSLKVLAPKIPKLTSLAPNPAAVGGMLYINGESLGTTVDVHVGNAMISGVHVNGGFGLSITLPPSIVIGSYQVWVTTTGGDTNKLNLTVTAGSPGPGPGPGTGTGGRRKPIIHSLSPSKVDRVKCITNGVHFTISGDNFSTTTENVIRSGLGGEQRMVSADGRTLYFDAGGGISMALPCTKPAMNPTNDLDIYVYVQNEFGTSEGKIFTVKGLPSLPGF